MGEQSEAERQELGMAGGVAIDQGAEADLVGDAGSGQAFGDDADDNAKHGGTPIEQLGPFELLHMNLGLATREILVVGGGVSHDVDEWVWAGAVNGRLKCKLSK